MIGESDSLKICSWNVNGIRAVAKKGFLDWVKKESPDILCLQETKAHPAQLEKELLEINGYTCYWNAARRKGYSGVATYSKIVPMAVDYDLGVEEFDQEGRLIISSYDKFTLLNVYFPNGQQNQDRLDYKLRFYARLMEVCDQMKVIQPHLIICGDFNTAHREIDLKNPKANENRSGFLPVERAVLDQFLNRGYIDVFRYLYPEKVQYSWWSYRTMARERNAGWRIDYFYVSQETLPYIEDCIILDEVTGSDHCPIILNLAGIQSR
jgi:exodeoxyribonuclease-3